VYDIGAPATEDERQPRHQRQVDARSLVHAHDLDPMGEVIGGERTVGRLFEGHDRHGGAGGALPDGEIEGDALAAANAERAEDVDDAQLQRPSPLSITRGVFKITLTSVVKKDAKRSRLAE
jgi:hypothetical protein